MSTTETRGVQPNTDILGRMNRVLDQMADQGRLSPRNAADIGHEAGILLDRINDLTAENRRLRIQLEVSERINESIRADRADVQAISDGWRDLVGKLTATPAQSTESPRHCTLCCKGEETGEPVEPGSFGDYHEGCMAESLREDEKLRRHA